MESKEKTEKLKTILYWNEAYGSTEYGFCCGQNPYFDFECPVKNCYVRHRYESLSTFETHAIFCCVKCFCIVVLEYVLKWVLEQKDEVDYIIKLS